MNGFIAVDSRVCSAPIFARRETVIGVSDFFKPTAKGRVLTESPRGFLVFEYKSSYIV